MKIIGSVDKKYIVLMKPAELGWVVNGKDEDPQDLPFEIELPVHPLARILGKLPLAQLQSLQKAVTLICEASVTGKEQGES